MLELHQNLDARERLASLTAVGILYVRENHRLLLRGAQGLLLVNEPDGVRRMGWDVLDTEQPLKILHELFIAELLLIDLV